MRAAVIVFPGSNCDTDMFHAVKDFTEAEVVEFVPHTAKSVAAYDAIFIPGGFSYGDYLRTGAIARFAPVMKSVSEEAAKGKTIVGVCNGFQILQEAGLLPGAMKRNKDLKFICRTVDLKVENNKTRFTSSYNEGDVLRIPVAHGEGNFECDEKTYNQLQQKGQIVFTYVDDVNGSKGQIAGVQNEAGNVLGMMPHPERAMEAWLGSEDGRNLFTSVYRNWRESNVVTN
ncbi:phosphoribosylformylglycinamidine synthase subunit PurQ [Geomicrobium sp. JCM 19038]|uniref:phosphoribosylformylglycinamidine synthase subunit PurQ n=1 Tax=Geomicrobium sp. JCM 19038 TaxID=1460635 RepID=UPI00045F28CE|nr:phosphoribosylformylglycinamidine synthase subunit PurQ [Geomicrobium sp. JCM 19038]GAK08876.1 phosphoribosylformylglycinamidine synthase, glutamine amidotransferase subunit [Geomicrobium sp. JCM 19038]